MDEAQDLAVGMADDDDDAAATETLRRLLALYCDSAHEQTARLKRVAARADAIEVEAHRARFQMSVQIRMA